MSSSVDDKEKFERKSPKYCLKNVLRANFHEYCENTTIHGVRYVGKGRMIKRIAWLVICCILFVFCGSQIYEIVLKWKQSPLVFSLDEKFSPIEQIEFPAVTICPQTLPNREIFNFTENFLQFYNGSLEFPDENDEKLFDAVTKICGKFLTKYYTDSFSDKTKSFTIFDSDISFEALKENTLLPKMVLPFCKGVLKIARYWECLSQFKPILLKQGVCYTFNLHSREKIFRPNVRYPFDEFPPENCSEGICYEPDNIFNVKDRRDRLHVRTRYYDDYSDTFCRPIPAVYIHNPHEIPWDYASKGYGLDIGQYERTAFSVTPFVIKTDDNLKDAFSSKDRECYFPDERPLRFFERYSQGNCELECWTNASISKYNCTTYWMPRTEEIKPCGMNIFFTGYELEDLTMSDSCNCLLDCNSVEYRVKKTGSHNVFFDETNYYTKKESESETKMYYEEAEIETEDIKTFEMWKIMEVEVYYEDSMFLAMRRHLAYTFADFLSQIGGILGCFLGMSILSIVEIVYFCTVQMCRKPKEELHEL